MKVFTMEDWNAFMRNELYVICQDEEATASFLLLCKVNKMQWVDEAPIDSWSPVGMYRVNDIAYEYVNREVQWGCGLAYARVTYGLDDEKERRLFPYRCIPQKKLVDIGV